MDKETAIRLLGGDGLGAKSRTAERLGITPSAVSQWPDELPEAVAHRIIAELARPYLPAPLARQLGISRR